MKTTSIENIKKDFFETKKEYLEFRKAWKDFVNSGKAKKYWVDVDKNWKRKVSDLEAKHHLLYAILREKDLSKCFKPVECSWKEKHGFENAYRDLMFDLSIIARHQGNRESMGSFHTKRVDRLIAPFGESLPLEKLAILFDHYLMGRTLTNIVEENGE